MSETEKWLRDEEARDYYTLNPYKQVKGYLEALARRAKLLSEHQYDRDQHCVDCGAHKEQPCYSDCAIAAEIEGLPREIT